MCENYKFNPKPWTSNPKPFQRTTNPESKRTKQRTKRSRDLEHIGIDKHKKQRSEYLLHNIEKKIERTNKETDEIIGEKEENKEWDSK